MSELLTTWEMFSKLKDGEVAVSDDEKVRVRKFGSHTYYKVDQDGNYLCQITLMPSLVERKWRILPPYVNFKKAYEAGKQGKKVKFLRDDGTLREVDFDICIEDNKLSYYTLKDLIEGKWIIEN